MLSGSYTMTTESNIHSHHLHPNPNRHVFNPLNSSTVTLEVEQGFNVASALSNMASCTDQLFLYSSFVAIRLTTNLPQFMNLPSMVVGFSGVNVGNR